MFTFPSPPFRTDTTGSSTSAQVRYPFKTSSIRLRRNMLQYVSLVLKHVETRVLETMVLYAIETMESQGRTFEFEAIAEDVELHLMEESKGWSTCVPIKLVNVSVKECSICIEDLSDVDEEAIVLHDCSHVFHKVCLLKWIRSKSSCPLCRHPIYCRKPKS